MGWPFGASRPRGQRSRASRASRASGPRPRRQAQEPEAEALAPALEAKRFDELPLSPAAQRALRESFGYEDLSEVQRQVLPIALVDSKDLVVRAHTGTGKTLAFLIPAFEALLASPQRRGVGLLVVAPTRELAQQISREADTLMSGEGIKTVTLIGGSSVREDQLKIRRSKPRAVVATPGRLLEHLERTYLFSTLFEQLETFVLDEADRMFSLGFASEVKEIVSYLPARRRTLLFSATVSEEVLEVAARTCRGNYRHVDCIGEDEAPTASMVDQSFVVLPGHQCVGALYNLLMNEMARDRFTHKILVFFPTARLTSFMAEFFRRQLKLTVSEIHGRRSAEERLAAQQYFYNNRSGILFTSDVSARGMDYPNVSLVVQFGAPATRDIYIHRVGRTARAGKEGRAVLLLGELERDFLRCTEDLPLAPYADADSLLRVNELFVKATTTWLASATLRSAATAAFASLLMHFKTTHRVLHMSDDAVVQASGDVLLGCGLVDQPVVSKRLAIMLGLENHPHLQSATRLGEDDPIDVAAAAGPNRPRPPRFGAGVLAAPRRPEAPVDPKKAKRLRWMDDI